MVEVEADDVNQKYFPCYVEKHRMILHRYVAFCIWPRELYWPRLSRKRRHKDKQKAAKYIFMPGLPEELSFRPPKGVKKELKPTTDTIIKESDGKLKQDQSVG